jgi:hypothetical protein
MSNFRATAEARYEPPIAPLTHTRTRTVLARQINTQPLPQQPKPNVQRQGGATMQRCCRHRCHYAIRSAELKYGRLADETYRGLFTVNIVRTSQYGT